MDPRQRRRNLLMAMSLGLFAIGIAFASVNYWIHLAGGWR